MNFFRRLLEQRAIEAELKGSQITLEPAELFELLHIVDKAKAVIENAEEYNRGLKWMINSDDFRNLSNALDNLEK